MTRMTLTLRASHSRESSQMMIRDDQDNLDDLHFSASNTRESHQMMIKDDLDDLHFIASNTRES